MKMSENNELIKEDIQENNNIITLENKINDIEIITDILDNVVNQNDKNISDVTYSRTSSLFNLFSSVELVDNNNNNSHMNNLSIIDNNIVVTIKEIHDEVIPSIYSIEKDILINDVKDSKNKEIKVIENDVIAIVQEKQEVKYDFYNPPPPPSYENKNLSLSIPSPPPIRRKSVKLQDGK